MPESKEVTIYDIARELKISSSSVSQGLKDDPSISKKTKKKIPESADKPGYRTNYFARNLRSKKISTIMLALRQKSINNPEDMVIVGFNNNPVAQVVEPNLSMNNNPGTEMGDVAAGQLIDRLKGKSPGQTICSIVLRSDFIARASSLKKTNTGRKSTQQS